MDKMVGPDFEKGPGQPGRGDRATLCLEHAV